MKSKVLSFVFLSSMFMSALAFGADGSISIENGGRDYIPSEFSHQGLAQVIDDYYPHIEGVKIVLYETLFQPSQKAPSPFFFSRCLFGTAQRVRTGRCNTLVRWISLTRKLKAQVIMPPPKAVSASARFTFLGSERITTLLPY